MKFRPSIRIGVSLFIFTILTFIISFYIKIENKIEFLKNDNFYTNIDLFQIEKIHFIYIILSIFIVLSFIKLFFDVIRKYSSFYIINNEDKTLYYTHGIIFKEENSINIPEIRKKTIFKPSFFGFLFNIRTIGIEVDGVEGWDVILHEISNWRKISNELTNIGNNNG